MKKIFFSLIVLCSCCNIWAQDTMHENIADSTRDTVVDEGEAGAVQANNVQPATNNSNNWLLPLLGGVAMGTVVGMVVVSVLKSKSTNITQQQTVDSTMSNTGNTVASNIDTKDAKALLAAWKKATQDLQEAQQHITTLEQHLEVYRNFDTTYYNEAFRKLVTPLQQALESGDRAALIETLVKISAQYSSLTRYKIAKKQPYDEANIHYLINQKSSIEGVPVVDSTTALDKIPKPIKVIMDMLKANESGGLDEVVVAGYKIKNL